MSSQKQKALQRVVVASLPLQAKRPPVHLALAASGFDSIPMFLPALAFSGQKGTIRICAALDLRGLLALLVHA